MSWTSPLQLPGESLIMLYFLGTNEQDLSYIPLFDNFSVFFFYDNLTKGYDPEMSNLHIILSCILVKVANIMNLGLVAMWCRSGARAIAETASTSMETTACPT